MTWYPVTHLIAGDAAVTIEQAEDGFALTTVTYNRSVAPWCDSYRLIGVNTQETAEEIDEVVKRNYMDSPESLYKRVA